MSHADVVRVKALYEDMQPRFLELYTLMMDIIQESKKPGYYELTELVDMGFFFREICTAANDLRLEAETKRGFLSRQIAYYVNQEMAEGKRTGWKVKGKYATGTAIVTQKPMLPKSGSPEYAEVLKYFGVTERAEIEGIFKLHWTKLSEYLTAKAEAGEVGVPRDLMRTKPHYDVSYRKKKNTTTK